MNDFAHDFVTAVNEDDTPFVYRWGTRQLTLKPQSRTVLPYEHMVTIAGDPFAKVARGARLAEEKRLRFRYDLGNTLHGWENRPKLRFFDQDDNEFMTVLVDPTGETGIVGPNGQHDPTDPAQIEGVIAKLQRQVHQLMQQLSTAEAGQASEARSDARGDAPSDEARARAAQQRPAPTPATKTDGPDRIPTSA